MPEQMSGGNPTCPVREGESLDWAKLDRHLKTVLPHLEGTPQVGQFPGGASNLTYRLRYANDTLVLRRPPLGTKAKSAHSMIREYEIVSRLRPVYPAVPEALHYCDDATIVGSEFYVMRSIPGQVLRRELPTDWNFDAAATRGFCERFWHKLVELHAVDYAAAGLADFGQPEGYARRQVIGWNGRYERALTPDVDEFLGVRDWLEAHLPPAPPRAAVLHGDFRIDNVIVAADEPHEILAVLDWELCALGDPLMDLGNALAYWIEPDDPDYLKALQLQPSTAAGMLTRAQILDLYQERTGVRIDDFTFYLVYGYWRTTVILQQIYYRYFHGQTKDARFATFGIAVQQLGAHCSRLIDR